MSDLATLTTLDRFEAAHLRVGRRGALPRRDLPRACDPAAEWWRSYVGLTPDACAVIDFDCQPSLAGFQNDCGCGCEQPVSLCPEVVDCGLFDCAGQGLEALCPLSTFVYPDGAGAQRGPPLRASR